MDYTTNRFQTVVVGNLGGEGRDLVTQVDIPLLVNTEKLDPGDELFVQVVPKPVPKKRPQTWRDGCTIRAKSKAKASEQAPPWAACSAAAGPPAGQAEAL